MITMKFDTIILLM